MTTQTFLAETMTPEKMSFLNELFKEKDGPFSDSFDGPPEKFVLNTVTALNNYIGEYSDKYENFPFDIPEKLVDTVLYILQERISRGVLTTENYKSRDREPVIVDSQDTYKVFAIVHGFAPSVDGLRGLDLRVIVGSKYYELSVKEAEGNVIVDYYSFENPEILE
ncbi:hypothetical protein HYV12_04500 [Candidatus Dojkabacteria bacterium]|nr:hypothetical protein [Candidatus Dojkabacteria bacterium]